MLIICFSYRHVNKESRKSERKISQLYFPHLELFLELLVCLLIFLKLFFFVFEKIINLCVNCVESCGTLWLNHKCSRPQSKSPLMHLLSHTLNELLVFFITLHRFELVSCSNYFIKENSKFTNSLHRYFRAVRDQIHYLLDFRL